MFDGSEKRNRQLAFELQYSHVCEKRSNIVLKLCIQHHFNPFFLFFRFIVPICHVFLIFLAFKYFHIIFIGM